MHLQIGVERSMMGIPKSSSGALLVVGSHQGEGARSISDWSGVATKGRVGGSARSQILQELGREVTG